MATPASPFDDTTLQAIVDAEPDPQVLVLPSGSELLITQANDAAMRLLGGCLPEVALIDWACREVWDSGAAETLNDLLWPGADHQWFDVRIRRLFGRISVTFTDVTRRHDAQDALLDSQCRYRLLAENAGDVVFQISGGRLEWVSGSVREVLGWEQADIVGRRVTDLLHPDDRDNCVAALRLSSGAAIIEARFLRRDRSWMWLSVEIRAAEDLGGSVSRVGSCRVMGAD